MTTQNCLNTTFPVGTPSGGTSSASFTAYGVITEGSSSTAPLQSVSPGTSGDVLTSNGTSASFSTPTGGSSALIYINAVTGSSVASLDLTSGIDSTYKNYMIIARGLSMGGLNSALRGRVSIDGGSSWISSGYSTAYVQAVSNTGSGSGGIAGTTNAITFFSNYNVSSTYGYLTADLLNIGTSANSSFSCVATNPSVSNRYVSITNTALPTSSTINAIQFYSNSGNISGTIELYGYTES